MMASSSVIHLIAASLDRIALSIIFALAIASLWLAPSSSSHETARRTRILIVMVVITFISICLDLLMRTAVMADVDIVQAWEFIPKVLGHSDYGFYWQWQSGMLAVMLVAALSGWRKSWITGSSFLLLLAALVTTLLQSVTSHAGEEGLWSIENMMNWLHLVSTSLWGGTVILYALLVLPALRDRRDMKQVADAAIRLSTLATLGLALVLLSGTFNTWHQLKALSDLWLTDYGKVLLIKLSLVAVMMLIGAINRFRWVPRLVSWHRKNGQQWGAPSDHFIRVLRIDSLVFVAISIAAIVLGTQTPPVHAM